MLLIVGFRCLNCPRILGLALCAYVVYPRLYCHFVGYVFAWVLFQVRVPFRKRGRVW